MFERPFDVCNVHRLPISGDPTSPSKRNKKRARQGEKETERHRELWSEDGNVVLVAQTFKVHRSTLSRHSSVFQDLFDLPQAAVEGTMDGCPVITLRDHALELVDLLNVIYHGTRSDSLH